MSERYTGGVAPSAGSGERVGTQHGPDWNPPKKSPVPPCDPNKKDGLKKHGRMTLRKGPID